MAAAQRGIGGDLFQQRGGGSLKFQFIRIERRAEEGALVDVNEEAAAAGGGDIAAEVPAVNQGFHGTRFERENFDVGIFKTGDVQRRRE